MKIAIRDNKIIALDNVNGIICDSIGEDTNHTVDDYIQVNGEYLLKVNNTAYLNEQAEQNRANAYKAEVDNLVAEYMRKKEFNLLDVEQAESLRLEIQSKVDDIKARYPYIEE